MAYRVRQGREFVTPPTNLSYTGSSVSYLRDIVEHLTDSFIKLPLSNGPSRRGKLCAEPGPREST